VFGSIASKAKDALALEQELGNAEIAKIEQISQVAQVASVFFKGRESGLGRKHRHDRDDAFYTGKSVIRRNVCQLTLFSWKWSETSPTITS
jgi:hypothetical protein